MPKVSNLVRELADRPHFVGGGFRTLISLNTESMDSLNRLAQALDTPSSVLASRLLAAALADAEEVATDIDLYDRS